MSKKGTEDKQEGAAGVAVSVAVPPPAAPDLQAQLLEMLASMSGEQRLEIIGQAQKQADGKIISKVEAAIVPLHLERKLPEGVIGFSAKWQGESWDINLLRLGKQRAVGAASTGSGVPLEGTVVKDRTPGIVRLLADDAKLYERRTVEGTTLYFPTPLGVEALGLEAGAVNVPDKSDRIGALCGLISTSHSAVADGHKAMGRGFLHSWCDREEQAGAAESTSSDPEVAKKGFKRVARAQKLRKEYLTDHSAAA